MVSIPATTAAEEPGAARSDAAPGARLPRAQLLTAYRQLRTIRAFEERLHAEHAAGDVPGPVHLYAGQEAIAVGVCAHLTRYDYIASTHRGHGHAIAKGCDLTEMMLEIFGKAGGLCGGKGGSMHITDIRTGMLGANGIAGGSAPLACGAALSAKLRSSGRIAVAFLGDGAANQGAFAESLTLAKVWQLPCVFVIEDNGYAQSTGTSFHLAGQDLLAKSAGAGAPAVLVDGYDFFAVHAAAGTAVARARAGGGPSVLICTAMRFFGHMEGLDRQLYRAPDEAERLRAAHDCIERFTVETIGPGHLTGNDLAQIDQEVRDEVDAAVAAARSASAPGRDALDTDVYVSY
jgi:TPP-dependent pyruvate/acetoin dehydrogenase alpha subunit